jgi:broad specificity phosphatase PhoE
MGARARETDAMLLRVLTPLSSSSSSTYDASTPNARDIERGVVRGDPRGEATGDAGDAAAHGRRGGWANARRAIAGVAGVASVALAVVSRASANAAATTMMTSTMADDGFEMRRMRVEASRAGLGARRRASSSGGDGALGDTGDDDPPFAAVKGYFAYESWFKSFERGEFPGDSHREPEDGGEETIQARDRLRTKKNVAWERIRADVAASHGTKKIVLFLRHGEATHNVWGNTVREELKVLPCSFEEKGDLLDPSLTSRGVRQIMDARASLVGEEGFYRAALGDDVADDVELPVLTSPLLRTLETALLATSGTRKAAKSIVVTDYLRERLEMNAPFEVRHPFSVESGDTKSASSFIASTRAKDCKFHEGLSEMFPDESFKIRVAAQDNCRADEIKPDSWKTCSHLGLTHQSDLDLGDIKSETMLGVMSRVKVVLANVFDKYQDDNVVLMVTHSDWIVAALMELYPDTLGFVPKNGEIVPIVIEDMREGANKRIDATSAKNSNRDDDEKDHHERRDEDEDEDEDEDDKRKDEDNERKDEDDERKDEDERKRKEEDEDKDEKPKKRKDKDNRKKRKDKDDKSKDEDEDEDYDDKRKDEDEDEDDKAMVNDSKRKTTDDDGDDEKETESAVHALFEDEDDDGEPKPKPAKKSDEKEGEDDEDVDDEAPKKSPVNREKVSLGVSQEFASRVLNSIRNVHEHFSRETT